MGDQYGRACLGPLGAPARRPLHREAALNNDEHQDLARAAYRCWEAVRTITDAVIHGPLDAETSSEYRGRLEQLRAEKAEADDRYDRALADFIA